MMNGGQAWRHFRRLTGWRVSRATFYCMLERGSIPAVTVSTGQRRTWLIRLSALEQFAQKLAA